MENRLPGENYVLEEPVTRKRQPAKPRIGTFRVAYPKHRSQSGGLLKDMYG